MPKAYFDSLVEAREFAKEKKQQGYWVKATNTAHWQHLTFAEAEAELFGRE